MLAHQEEGKEEQKAGASYVGAPTGLAPKVEIVMPTNPSGRKPPKKVVQAYESLAELGFGYVGQSEITMWHRPTKDQVKLAKELLGITTIVTVQSPKEQPDDVRKPCQANGIRHVFIKLEGASERFLGDPTVQAGLKKDLRKLYEHMCQNQERVLLHCAAGIHRTGTCTYALLRWSGLDPAAAMETLRGIRACTHAQVGDWRIKAAEDNIV